MGRSTFPLTQGEYGGAASGLNPLVGAEAGECLIPLHRSGQMPDYHVLHVIVENLSRDSAEETESMLVAVQEVGHGAAVYELYVHMPGVAQDHYEAVDSSYGAVTVGYLEIPEIHLSLLSGQGLKPDVGGAVPLFLYPLNVSAHHIVGTDVALYLYEVIHPGRQVILLA